MAAPGNFVLVEEGTGSADAKEWLRGANRRVDDWLYELADSLTFFAAGRLVEHAPGKIKGLVGTKPAHETITGAFEGVAGVEPDILQENFHRGVGSDPADYPVFVEVGTGVFGPVGTVISSMGGRLMGPIPWEGRQIFTRVVQGQRPQLYAERSFLELVAVTPVRIKEELPSLGRPQ